jgi:asparagine synthase (glutamine-hydrolysing)
LLSLPYIQPRLNQVKVADYLVPMFEDNRSTFYRNIFRLPPAHSMLVDGEGTRLQEYWSLDPGREIRLASDREYAEAFRDIFEEAVSCRLHGAGPVGSLLSGGMDSSSVACMARLLQDGGPNVPLHTFSAIFDDVRECDERPYIDAVLGQGGYEGHYVHADQLSPLTDADRMFWHEDEPFYAPNLFMHWALYGAAQEQGVRVLLDGLDGDTTVSHGLPRFIELARSGRWWSLYKETGALANNWNIPHRRLLWRRGVKPAIPDSARRARRKLLGRDRAGWQKNPTIRPDFARRFGLAERYEALEGERSIPVVTVRQEHYRRLIAGILPFVLEIADRAAAAFALEARYPFFDVRLIEFCLALPSEQKLSQGWTRAILHNAMEGILPPKVQWRGSKSNLGPNFNRGLLVGDRELVERVLLTDPGEIEDYVDIDALRQIYANCRAQVDHKDVMITWKAVSLALWLQYSGLNP